MQLTTLLDRLNQGSSTSWPILIDEPTDLVTAASPELGSVAPCQSAQDADLWFAERSADVERAKALCRTCPVREACLAGAIERQEPWGVWGGEVFVDGAVTAFKRGRGRPPKTPAVA